MMLSRIFWVGLTGIALIIGMVLQDGNRVFSWVSGDDVSTVTERAIEGKVERAVEAGLGKMEVVGSDGRQIDVPPESKRALADAIGRLVEAETDLALLRIRDGNAEDMRAANARRAQARAEVDRLKTAIERREDAAVDASLDRRDADRDQIRREVREDVRDAVRGAVGN